MYNNNKKIIIGLFGFGTVGEGLYKLINRQFSSQYEIKKICIRDPAKPRTLPTDLLTTNPSDIFNDASIDVWIELVSDANFAVSILNEALLRNKPLISASKKMIALQPTSAGRHHLRYEASVAGCIPILDTLDRYYRHQDIHRIKAILNGTCNMILTQMGTGNCSFQEALKLAQQAGFAESDPSLDIDGHDSVFKLCILARHAFGVVPDPDSVTFCGIRELVSEDVEWATANGCTIKLIADISVNDQALTAYVAPTLVPRTAQLAMVKNEYNAIEVHTVEADIQVYTGKGAGQLPTASAVLFDLDAIIHESYYSYDKEKRSDRRFNPLQLCKVAIRCEYGEALPFEPLQHFQSRQVRTKTYHEVLCMNQDLMNWKRQDERATWIVLSEQHDPTSCVATLASLSEKLK